MSQYLEVIPYNCENLIRLFAEKSRALPAIVNTKIHSAYFDGYFGALRTRTIIIENDYIDRDFLEDFSSYYVRCFYDYPRKCTRLHFFDIEFSEAHFCDLLKGEGIELLKLQEAYLGFIVIKPLPQTIIGRTCLRTYSEENRRKFPVVRIYEANLFGITLQVETLAFQEQDRVAAACATSALWSVFQCTGKLFQHPILSPVEITKQANIFPDYDMPSRSLPSGGLTLAQMAHAVRSVSLEPYFQRVSGIHELKSTLYAYLRGKIPLIMNMCLYDIPVQSGKDAERLGGHAVAITGYSLGHDISDFDESIGSLLRAYRIDRIYVHDDQVGPFARMVLDGIKVVSEEGIELESLSTSWEGKCGGIIRGVPINLLVPLYHKIRIPFSTVHGVINSFDAFIERLRKEGVPLTKQRLEWDIFLTTVNDFRKNIISSGYLDKDCRKDVLLKNMPRFMWRASAYNGDTIALDLLFDATDIEQGTFFVHAVEYDSTLSLILRIVSKVENLAKVFQTDLAWRIFEWFKKQ